MTGRDRSVLLIVALLAAAIGSWLMVIQPKRDQASKLGSQLQAAQSQLQTARAQIAQNEAARNAFSVNYTTIARLGEAVPADDNVPSLIVQVQSAASAARVDFRSLQLTSSGASSPAPAPTPAGTSSATSAASAAATQASTATLPPGASVGPAGFPTEPFTFTFHGNFFHLADFLNRLQRFVVTTNQRVAVSGRLMTLNAISFGPGPNGFPQINAAVSATTYLVPQAQGLTAGATASGPAGATSQRISTRSASSPAAPAVVATP